MSSDIFKSLNSIDEKNGRFKNLYNLPGFNYKNAPVKITDNLNINNHFINNDKVIDEKIFVKFFGIMNFDKNKNKNKNKKETRKKLDKKDKKDTRKNKK